MKTMTMCKKCAAAGETMPRIPDPPYDNCPENCCPVCWYRYGTTISICRPLSRLSDTGEGGDQDAD